MKNLYSICLLALLLFVTSHSYALRSPIVTIELAKPLSDLYKKKMSRIDFKMTRANGKIEYTQTYDDYARIPWRKLTIACNQGKLSQGSFIIDYDSLIANNYKIVFNIRLEESSNILERTIIHQLPEILDIELKERRIHAYAKNSNAINLITTGSTYEISNKSPLAILSMKDIEWKVPEDITLSKSTYVYHPTRETYRERLFMLMTCKKLNIVRTAEIVVEPAKKLLLNYSVSKGENGPRGKDGARGSLGEHGKDGTPGWTGGDGEKGQEIDILIRSKSPTTIEILTFWKDSMIRYSMPRSSHILVSVRGGAGGHGGNGGDGGEGGGSTVEYDAGEDGYGGIGGHGGNGGKGGIVNIYTDIPLYILINTVELDLEGGSKGVAGSGCRGEISGANGTNGQKGDKGTVSYIIQSTKDINDLFGTYE